MSRPAGALRLSSIVLALSVASPLAAQDLFSRGDANQDGRFDLSDCVASLGNLFLGTPLPDCDDAADFNDDAAVDVSDPVFGLNFLFLGGPAIPPPTASCGDDPTADALGCATFTACPVDCFTDEDLAPLLVETFGAGACIPVEALVTEFAGTIVTVCPAAEAAPDCNGTGAPGCPLVIDTVEGEVHAADREVLVHVEGRIDQLPISLDGLVRTVCRVNLTFTSDAIVPFRARTVDDGVLEVTSLSTPQLTNTDVQVAVTGGIICNLIAAQQDTLVEAGIDQLEEAMAAIVLELEPQVVGVLVCED